MNGKNIQITKSNDIFSNILSGFLGKYERPYQREKQLKELANEIVKLLKEQRKIEIPDIMEKFNVDAIDAITAVKILREKGIVREID